MPLSVSSSWVRLKKAGTRLIGGKSFLLTLLASAVRSLDLDRLNGLTVVADAEAEAELDGEPLGEIVAAVPDMREGCRPAIGCFAEGSPAFPASARFIRCSPSLLLDPRTSSWRPLLSPITAPLSMAESLISACSSVAVDLIELTSVLLSESMSPPSLPLLCLLESSGATKSLRFMDACCSLNALRTMALASLTTESGALGIFLASPTSNVIKPRRSEESWHSSEV
mmetsp:Transcript_7246/g.19877  ORF Transcript_7246/g.19877 Transcript_7246/m.19877 type:complete len:226 (-) Transcript_7246:1586-2263(-)